MLFTRLYIHEKLLYYLLTNTISLNRLKDPVPKLCKKLTFFPFELYFI